MPHSSEEKRRRYQDRITAKLCIRCGRPVECYVLCWACRIKNQARTDTKAQWVFDKRVDREERLNTKYRLIQIKDAAAILGVSSSQIRLLIFRKKIEVNRREMGQAWLRRKDVMSLKRRTNGA